VLVVEDDLDVREALVQLLEVEGYRVIGVSNGREAMQHLRGGEAPRVILLDLMMPVMDGLEFRGEQLQDPALAAIPVILISADGTVREKAAVLQTAGYLTNPIEVESLLALVARYR
jgi:CheY-like chemotaxis protein